MDFDLQTKALFSLFSNYSYFIATVSSEFRILCRILCLCSIICLHKLSFYSTYDLACYDLACYLLVAAKYSLLKPSVNFNNNIIVRMHLVCENFFCEVYIDPDNLIPMHAYL